MNNESSAPSDIHCPHFTKCSGCSIDTKVNEPPVLKEMVSWFGEKGIKNFVLHMDKATNWRLRAKLAVRGQSQNPLIGLYEEGSHRVVNIPDCRVHHPAINLAVERIKAFIKQQNISIYREKDHTGELRYLQIVVERSTGRVQVAFALNFLPQDEAFCLRWREKLELLWSSFENEWHSFSINFNTRKDNVIFSTLWELWFGNQFLWESFLGVDVCFQASSFAQANLDQFECLLKQVQNWTSPHVRVAEYYAGVGVIGLSLVSKSKDVRCCEINPHANFCFEEAQKHLSKENAQKISWFQGPSEKFSEWLSDADIIVVDPPRKGLDEKFLKELKQINRSVQLIYVSCGWPAFRRDAEVLCASGWRIQKAEGHLFFPGTNHVETLALFVKNDQKPSF